MDSPGPIIRERGRIYERGGKVSRSIIEIACVYRSRRVSFREKLAPEMKNMPPSESAFATPERRGVSVVAAASAEDTTNTPLANINSFSGDPNFMTSLARGLTVIQAFTQKKRQLTIAQLSVKTGLSRA